MLLEDGKRRDVLVKKLGQSGQAQLLVAVIAGIVAILAGMYSMDLSRKSAESQSDQSRLSESRAALDEALQFASNAYQTLVGCDPWLLNNRLNYLQTDGTFGTTVGRRRMTISMNANSYRIARTYTVSFGSVRYLAWTGGVFDGSSALPDVLPTYDTTGVFKSQDAVIEAWLTDENRTRVAQRAILINTCTTPCSAGQRRATSTSAYAGTGSLFCHNQPDRTTGGIHDVFAYHQIDTQLYPVAEPMSANQCVGAVAFATSCVDVCSVITGASEILQAREFIRSGTSGPLYTTHIAQFAGAGADPTGTAGTQGCLDLNGDAVVDLKDIGILEKFQRGFLPRIPINF